MGVGAYACYKLTTVFPGVNIIVWILVSGFFSAAIGVLFGLPSPAHQGLLPRGRDARGAVLPGVVLQPRALALQLQRLGRDRGAAADALRRPIVGPTATPADALPRRADASSSLLTWVASNLVHGRIGRMWMAVRDMDIAAELMGIRLLQTKLLAFAVSSYLLRRRRAP